MLVLGLWLGLAQPAAAVDIPATCADLQAKLDASQSGDVIILSGICTNQSFTLRDNPPGPRVPGIVLKGEGGDDGFDGGASRILTGTNTHRLQIDNLLFRDGVADDGDGGAIRITGDSNVFLTSNRFFNNHAAGDGGAVSIEAGENPTPGENDAAATSLLGNTFGSFGPSPTGQRGGEQAAPEGNTADGKGGAVNIEISHGNGNGGLSSNVFEGNAADGPGGGFAITLNPEFAENISIEGNQVVGNHSGAHGGGGAADLNGPSAYRVTNNNFTGNTVEPPPVGGAAFPAGNSHFGGGLFTQLGGNRVFMHTNRFDGNALLTFPNGENYGGGGAWFENGGIESENDRFTNNTVAGQPDVVIDGERQAEQAAFDSEGGGIGYVRGSTEFDSFNALNLVSAGNTIGAHGEAGGIYVGGEPPAILKLVNASVAGNQVGTDEAPGTNAGLGGDGNDHLDLRNSIVFGNTGGTPEIGGFAQNTAAPGGVGADSIDVQFTDACVRPGVPFDGPGNICVDPKLAHPGPGIAGTAAVGANQVGGDVHLTDQSLPVIDEASDALFFEAGEVCCDYEGDQRGVQGKPGTSAAGVAGNTDMGADEAPAFVAPQPTPPAIAQAVLGVQPPPGVAPAECVRREISLVRADVRGRNVVLRGLVVRRLAGRPVSIFGNYKPAGGSQTTKLATVTPNANGEFTATVPRPSRKQFIKTRYRAQVDRFRSIPLKLPQSLSSSSVRAQGLQITLRGKVKRSLLGRRNPVIIKRLVCGRYRTVGQARPDGNGNYVATFSVPTGTTAALFRAETRVLDRPGSGRYVKQYARAISITLTDQTG